MTTTSEAARARPFIVGNWKMNGLAADLAQLEPLADGLAARPGVRTALCLPATLIAEAVAAAGLRSGAVEIGGQDCRAEASGAYTGDVSAEMLADAGARLVILGHSERRAGHGETDAMVAAKVEAALRAGLEPIVCVGETLEQRQAGRAAAVVEGQLAGSLPPSLTGRAFSVAYEPVWAIGTGLTPTLAEIIEVHARIRAALAAAYPQGEGVPILYGGSVKPANAAEILHAPEVGGALVGGLLKADDLLAIIAAAV